MTRRAALEAFASGLVAARQSDSLRGAAMLHANQAWARFFDEADLCGLTGVVLTGVARTADPGGTASAIEALAAADYRRG